MVYYGRCEPGAQHCLPGRHLGYSSAQYPLATYGAYFSRVSTSHMGTLSDTLALSSYKNMHVCDKLCMLVLGICFRDFCMIMNVFDAWCFL